VSTTPAIQPGTAKAATIVSRRLDEQAAMLFWTTLLGVAASFCGALVALALHLDLTMLEGAFLGAFIGSTPLILLPNLARLSLGPSSHLCDRGHPTFRLSSLVVVALMVLTRIYIKWPADGAVSPITYAGLVAALLATWFAPHFPRALRVWWISQWAHVTASTPDGLDQGIS
jgi:hypothetical protein